MRHDLLLDRLMRIGIATFVTDEGAAPGELARMIEERGFDALFVAEHTHIPTATQLRYPAHGQDRKYFRSFDPFITLAAAATTTERILLGTGVALIGQRDPIITAKEVACLDVLSGGRIVLGVGAGWNRPEMTNHGTDPRTRGRLVNERLSAIRRIWTEEIAEFHGRFVDFGPMRCWPKPVQRPHPPIYVGGNSPAAYPRIAEHGSGWLPNGLPDAAEFGARIAAMRERAGWEVPVTVFGSSARRGELDSYAKLGIERVLVWLATLPADRSASELDAMTGLVAAYR